MTREDPGDLICGGSEDWEDGESGGSERTTSHTMLSSTGR